MQIVIVGLIGVYVAWAAFIAWRWREIDTEARESYARQRADGAISSAIAEADFVQIFQRAYGPRGTIYMFLSSGLAMLSMPVIVMVTSTLWYRLWLATGSNEVFAEGTLIHSFYLAVTTMGVFVGIAAFFMRRYHTHAPEKFAVELKQLTERDA